MKISALRPGLLAGLLFAWTSAGVLTAGPAFATSDKDCDRPHPPAVPDGSSASEVDMVGASQRTKLYLASVETFLACLEEARATVTETGREVKLKRIDRKKTEVETERTQMLAKFNEQVRVYKVRNGEAVESAPSAAPPATAPKPR